MLNLVKRLLRNLFSQSTPPCQAFLTNEYQHHNQRRQEHLACLGLDIAQKTVMEVGAGIGDHTSFFVDRGCDVVSTEAREENIKILRSRFPNLRTFVLDLDNPPSTFNETFDIVYCYGLLYHLKEPENAIKFMATCCKSMLLLETCVSFGDGDELYPCYEDTSNPTQAISGHGCRPTRRWLYNRLKDHFEHVYLPKTQPNNEQFPIDWTLPAPKKGLTRAVFVASREALNNDTLIESIPDKQTRH